TPTDELRAQSGGIAEHPSLDDASIADSEERRAGILDSPAGRRNAPNRAAVGAGIGEAGRDLIALRHQRVDPGVEIRERGADLLDVASKPPAALDRRAQRATKDQLGSYQLVD